MKCENCGKNEVSFVYRSSINGRTEEHHLCQACAEKLGYTQKLFARRPSMMDSFFGNDDRLYRCMPPCRGQCSRSDRGHRNCRYCFDRDYVPCP